MRTTFSTYFKWMPFFLFLVALPLQLQASYILLYSTNDNGAITFTGNTLGLNKADNQNQPGNSGSIGVFITADVTALVTRGGTYIVGCVPASVTSYDATSVNGGTIVMQTDGTYLYTPPTDFSGIDTFTYTAMDSSGNDTKATVTIKALPLANNDTAITAANTTLVGPSVLLNDVGSTLTVTDFDSFSIQGGIVSVNENGTYIYIPPTGFSGIDTFNYTAIDSFGNLTTATVTINVIPIAIDDEGTTFENITLNGASVLINDVGSDLTIFTYDVVSAEGGTVSMNPLTGQYIYTPSLGFTGIDTFTYTIIDSSDQTATATVTITVEPVPVPVGIVATLDKCALINKTYYRLEMTWSAASASASIVSYRIYYLGVIVAEIPSAGPLVFKVCLKNKESAQLYQISAVNSEGAESELINIEVE